MAKGKGNSVFQDGRWLSPKKIWFHLLLALLVTIVLVTIALIGLRVFTRHGEEVEMPDFMGQDSQMLIEEATSNDFVLVVADYVFDKKTPEGQVLKQNPAPGEKVKKGRKVYLTVASATPPKVKMMELKDVSLRQAEIMLKAVGLELGDVIYKPNEYENVVMEQLYRGRPITPGTEISVGEKVTLVVGRDVNKMATGLETENGE